MKARRYLKCRTPIKGIPVFCAANEGQMVGLFDTVVSREEADEIIEREL